MEHFDIQKEREMELALRSESHSVFGFFIRNFRVTYLIILSLVFLGAFAIFTLPREADPEVKIPFAVVLTVYPGASPKDTEELITEKIETEVKNLPDLRRYTSNSGAGFSSVFVEFTAEADLKDSYQKLREAVNKVAPSLPQEADTPQVQEIRISDMPIVSYSIVYDAKIEDLKPYADLIQKELEGIEGISKVDVAGVAEREFQVIVDQTKLINYGVSFLQVVGAIGANNFTAPAGSLEIDGFEYSIRFKNKIETIENLANLPIVAKANSIIYLKDVASINDTFKERATISKIGLPGKEARNTISLRVFKKTGGNIVSIVENADQVVANFQRSGKLPREMVIEKTGDNAWFIKDTLNQLGFSGLQTFILIVILLLIVLGLRGALITGLAVPLAFLMAFIFLMLQGATLNSIVLYSLVISLGLMVDNAIIIMEGINEYMTEYNKTPREAAILSVWNFKWAIVSGTLTTVAAFLPMLLVSGILGEFFAYIPKTITATLLSSLFVALIVIPTLAARFVKAKNNNHIKVNRRYQFCKNCLKRFKEKYRVVMIDILRSKKKRRIILASSWLALILALAVPISGMMKIEMFSVLDFDMMLVGIKLAPGSSVEETSQIVDQVEKIVAQTPELKSYVIVQGSLSSFSSFEGSSSGDHLATVTINLTPTSMRDIKSFEIAQILRPKLEAIQGAVVVLEEVSAGPPSGAPVEVRIFSDSLADLSTVASDMVDILENIEGTVNVKDSLQNSSGEFVFTVNAPMASFYGIDPFSVATVLRGAVFGVKATAVVLDGDDVDITVKYDQEQFKTADDLANLQLLTLTGKTVSLSQIADFSLEPSLLSISHRDGKKTVSVSSSITPSANLAVILKELDKEIKNMILPQGVNIEVGGEIEDIEQSYRETFISMILAVILIAFILVLQFNSFVQPLIIIFALPLAVIGVILGLNLLRMPFSFPAFLGIVSLAGIAVNDAIVLIDRANKNIKNGMEKVEALAEAGAARMQPIFLTSLTTIFGVLPLAFVAELWQGFSVTLIFGLIFSTSLTLVIIPILYNALTKTVKHGT